MEFKLNKGIPFEAFLNFYGRVSPDVAEPITKPSPVITPAPSQDDPFNVPAPLVDPTPKGFL